jgi:hypothetical protein
MSWIINGSFSSKQPVGWILTYGFTSDQLMELEDEDDY